MREREIEYKSGSDLDHSLSDDVSQWPALHVLHHNEKVHLHHESLLEVDKVWVIQLLHHLYFHQNKPEKVQ